MILFHYSCHFMNIITPCIYIVFLLINCGIIYSDFRYKKIPNKALIALCILLPFWIFFLYWNHAVWSFQNIILLSFYSVLNFIIVFLLYHFKIWWAGDSKYIYILSLYLPSYSLIILFWNTALITLTSFGIYFIYFYTLKLVLMKDFRTYIWSTIKQDSYKKTLSIFDSSKPYTRIINGLFWFLILYMWIRFLKFVFMWFFDLSSISVSQYYGINLINIVFISLIICSYLSVFLIRLFFQFIEKKLKKWTMIKSISIYVASIILVATIFFQYQKSPEQTLHFLKLSGSIYLAIFFWFLLLRYLVETSFYISERYIASIDSLRAGMIVDRNHLKRLLRWRWVLADDMDYEISTKILTSQDIKNLKKTIKYINRSIEKNEKQEDKIESIMIIRTFPYAIFILAWFALSLFFENQIIEYILWFLRMFFIK